MLPSCQGRGHPAVAPRRMTFCRHEKGGGHAVVFLSLLFNHLSGRTSVNSMDGLNSNTSLCGRSSSDLHRKLYMTPLVRYKAHIWETRVAHACQIKHCERKALPQSGIMPNQALAASKTLTSLRKRERLCRFFGRHSMSTNEHLHVRHSVLSQKFNLLSKQHQYHYIFWVC
jgi:hypothetical protein